jgi:hypothetical protein
MAGSYRDSPTEGRAIPLAVFLRSGHTLSLGAAEGEPLLLALFARAASFVAGENAIYHATGRRVRDLPTTIDKLLRSP